MTVTARRGLTAVEIAAIVVATLFTAAGLGAVAALHPTKRPAVPRHRAAAAPTAQPSSTHPTQWVLVSVGDSVPAGSSCACTAFPDVYAQRISTRTNVPVSVRNDSLPGLTSGGLANELRTSASLRSHVATADIITVTIGANDFSFDRYRSGGCGGLACYEPDLAQLSANLDDSLNTIAQLLDGRPAAVRVTGYWEIWRDGAVGRKSGTQYMQVDDALTRQVNAVIANRATAHGVTYVDLYHAFHGPDGDRDDTSLLAPDGDHPSGMGQELIAAVLLATGLAPLLV